MKSLSKKETYNEYLEPELFQSFYGQFVSIKDFLGDTHQCYCINADTAELISSLPVRKLSLNWSLQPRPRQPALLIARRGSLTVYQTQHGFFVRRWFRSNGRQNNFTLAHQLLGNPVVFPSLEFGRAAAELCFPKPNRKLGYLWWTYPAILH
jgi:hypothetical protein